MKKNIKCPNCKTSFELEDGLLQDFILSIRKELNQELNLTIKTKDKLLSDMKDQLAKIKQKLDNSSQQMSGEIQELEIEDILSLTFPTDLISPVAKGVRGADCKQQVFHNGIEIGTILFESKNVKAFSEQWIAKLKKDNLQSKCSLSLIITSAMPSDIKGKFGVKDGIWICLFEAEAIKQLVTVLRFSLMKLHQVATSNCNGNVKADKLWKYVNSQDFSNLMESVLNGYTNLDQSYQDEKKKLTALWKLRELCLKEMLESTLELFTTMKGISPEIPSIKMLELPQVD